MSNNEENEMMPENKLDAIKEIIFGENIKAYDSEFRQLKEEIKIQGNEIEREVERVKEEVQRVKADFDKQLGQLRQELAKLNDAKSDRKALAKMLKGIAEKLEK